MRRLPAIQQALEVSLDADAKVMIYSTLTHTAPEPYEARLACMSGPVVSNLWRPYLPAKVLIVLNTMSASTRLRASGGKSERLTPTMNGLRSVIVI